MEQAVNKRFVIIGCKDTDKEAIARPTITYGQDAWRRLKKNPIAMISLGVLVLMALVALLGPLLCGQDFAAMEPTLKNLPPSAQHWFGTDMLGRDLFARVCVGARISLLIALVCTLVQVVVGCAYGGIMAYFGGWVDNIMMRVIEVLMSLPYLLVVIIVMLVLGNSVPSLLAALCVTSWCNTARAMRGVILQLKSSEYVMAAPGPGRACPPGDYEAPASQHHRHPDPEHRYVHPQLYLSGVHAGLSGHWPAAPGHLAGRADLAGAGGYGVLSPAADLPCGGAGAHCPGV